MIRGSAQRAALSPGHPARLTTLLMFSRDASSRSLSRLAARKRPNSRPVRSFSSRASQLFASLPSRSKIPASSTEIAAFPPRGTAGPCSRPAADSCPVGILPAYLHATNPTGVDPRSGKATVTLPDRRPPAEAGTLPPWAALQPSRLVLGLDVFDAVLDRGVRARFGNLGDPSGQRVEINIHDREADDGLREDLSKFLEAIFNPPCLRSGIRHLPAGRSAVNTARPTQWCQRVTDRSTICERATVMRGSPLATLVVYIRDSIPVK